MWYVLGIIQNLEANLSKFYLPIFERAGYSYNIYNIFFPAFKMQICERSLTTATGGPTGPPATSFVRAEMLPSGYLIRPCEGGGSMIHIVDHIDLDVSLKNIGELEF